MFGYVLSTSNAEKALVMLVGTNHPSLIQAVMDYVTAEPESAKFRSWCFVFRSVGEISFYGDGFVSSWTSQGAYIVSCFVFDLELDGLSVCGIGIYVGGRLDFVGINTWK